MEINNKLQTYCGGCCDTTFHTIAGLKKVDGNFDYRITVYYTIVECDGCKRVSYRTETIDYDSMSYDVIENEYLPDTSIQIFPQSIPFHKDIEGLHHLPNTVAAVYLETLKAFAAESFLLTAVGFRSVIEAICIDKKIKIKDIEDLKPQIDKLQDRGFITSMEANRLHTIRFLGNDSVHDMIIPRKEDLNVVLDIIEHLLENLYIIDKKIRGGLLKVVDTFDGFRTLLNKVINELEIGSELTLPKILGKSARRLNVKKLDFEAELIKIIKEGTYKKLSLGKCIPPKNVNDREIQFYIVLSRDYDKGADI